MTAPRLLSAAALAVLSTFAAAPSAHADSISFLRGGNIWVSSTDGATQVQLTTAGGYSYQSRADDGSFIALHGRQLHRLAATGQLVAAFNTPVSFESPAGKPYFKGPFEPEISPDGSKVAYEYWHQDYGLPGCTPTWECNRISVGIGYTYPDRSTGWDEPGLGRQSGWTDPSWIDNSTLLLSDKSVYPNADTIIDRPGDGNDQIERWFEDGDAWHLKDAEISRRGDAAVVVSTKPRRADEPRWGQEDDQVRIYRLSGPAPALPQGCFAIFDETRVMNSPTFAPDGRAVAFASQQRHASDTRPNTIEVADLPSQAGGCASPEEGSRDLIVDAVNPDWSPAGVPDLPKPDPGKDQDKGGGTDPGNKGQTDPGNHGSQDPGKNGTTIPPGTQVVTKGGVTFTVSPVKVADAVKRGLRPEIAVPAAGRVELVAIYKGKKVATGKATTKAAGTLKPKLSFTVSGKRALKKVKQAQLTVRFTFRPKSGKAVTGTTKLTLKP